MFSLGRPEMSTRTNPSSSEKVITEDVQARKSAQQTLLECQSVWNQRYTNWKLGRNMSVLLTIVSDAYNA